MWNQVFMDFGAQVCRPTPSCGECPVASECEWHDAGHPEPDPAVGSAGVSGRQARFEGSDRQARGRLMAALVDGGVRIDDVARVMRCEAERAERLADALQRDGLVVMQDGWILLP